MNAIHSLIYKAQIKNHARMYRNATILQFHGRNPFHEFTNHYFFIFYETLLGDHKKLHHTSQIDRDKRMKISEKDNDKIAPAE